MLCKFADFYVDYLSVEIYMEHFLYDYSSIVSGEKER